MLTSPGPSPGPSLGPSVVDDLRASASARPRHLAVADSTRRLTYAGLLESALLLAGELHGCGVRRGDRVVVVMRNSVDAAVAVFGTLLAGGCLVALDPTTPEERLLALLTKTGAAAVVCDPAAGARVKAAARQASPAPLVLDGSRTAEGRSPEPAALLSTDLAAIVFTSGSTGEPRGATFLHSNVSFIVSSVLGYLPMTPADRVLSVLPLSHTYGLYQLLMSVRLGASLHLRPGPGPIGTLLADLRQERVTVLPGVPSLWQLLCRSEAAPVPLPEVRLLTNAGAALPISRVTDLRALFPRAQLFAMYGQTECGRISYLAPELLAAHPDSVGVAIPGTEAWLEDDAGRPPADGEVGELVVRGEHVMQGYWEDPQATLRKLAAGRWPGDRVLRTGDLFRRDASGYLCFVARRDDMITTGGEKVAPLEVERVLCTAPGIAEAAVVGAPDPVLGEAVVAHVVAVPGADPDPRALRRHCAQHLEVSKVPRVIVVHPALPRLPSGKLDRRALVEPDESVPAQVRVGAGAG